LKYIHYFILILLLGIAYPSYARIADDVVPDTIVLHEVQHSSIDSVTDIVDSLHFEGVKIQDTITSFRAMLDSLERKTLDTDEMLLDLVAKQSQALHANDTIWEKYPHPLCMMLMYVPTTFPSITDTTSRDEYSIPAIRAKARRYITTHYADLYVSVSDTSRLKQMAINDLEVQHAIIKDLEEDRLDIERALKYVNSPWRRQLNLSLQITQNYATDNWYQGSANAFAMLAGVKGFINYKKENISWENNAEWRAGVSTVSGDSLRVMSVTDDIFRVNSKFGYQLHKKWYLSAIGELKTNFWNHYQKNSHELSTAFLTPIRFTLGVGVDYKPLKGLSVNIAPATYKMVCAAAANSRSIDVTEYGIEEGKIALNELGSSLRVDWKWRPLREIILEANFYFFTNYKRIETELEVNVDFVINRYLSAKVMLHPRYDSTVELTDDIKTKMQFKELISVGFSHTFR